MADGSMPCSVGIEVTGNVKKVYDITGMSHQVQPDGTIIYAAETACGRTITTTKNPAKGCVDGSLYEVEISEANSFEIERSYFGLEGSDACRVFNGYSIGWERMKNV